MEIGREGSEAAYWLSRAIRPYGSHMGVAPTSMAAAFGCIMGIMRSTLDFDLLRFISNPPADISGPRRAFMIATLAH
jgi:hypothetical protein